MAQLVCAQKFHIANLIFPQWCIKQAGVKNVCAQQVTTPKNISRKNFFGPLFIRKLNIVGKDNIQHGF